MYWLSRPKWHQRTRRGDKNRQRVSEPTSVQQQRQPETSLWYCCGLVYRTTWVKVSDNKVVYLPVDKVIRLANSHNPVPCLLLDIFLTGLCVSVWGQCSDCDMGVRTEKLISSLLFWINQATFYTSCFHQEIHYLLYPLPSVSWQGPDPCRQ